MSIVTDCPIASLAVYPNKRSAPLFQLRMRPFKSLLMMASSEDSHDRGQHRIALALLGGASQGLHLLGCLRADDENAANAMRCGRIVDGTVAIGPIHILKPAIARDGNELALMPGRTPPRHHLINLGTDGVPNLAPRLPGRDGQGSPDGAPGRSICGKHRCRGRRAADPRICTWDDRCSASRGQSCSGIEASRGSAQRGGGPVMGAHQRTHLAAVVQELRYGRCFGRKLNGWLGNRAISIICKHERGQMDRTAESVTCPYRRFFKYLPKAALKKRILKIRKRTLGRLVRTLGPRTGQRKSRPAARGPNSCRYKRNTRFYVWPAFTGDRRCYLGKERGQKGFDLRRC